MIDALGNPRSVLLLGGTSDIGLAIVERLSPERPLRVTLAARPGARREAAVDRLHRRGHEVRTVDFEATDLDGHAEVVDESFDGSFGDVDVTVAGCRPSRSDCLGGAHGDCLRGWSRRCR